jgi:hypothetical protein
MDFIFFLIFFIPMAYIAVKYTHDTGAGTGVKIVSVIAAFIFFLAITNALEATFPGGITIGQLLNTVNLTSTDTMWIHNNTHNENAFNTSLSDYVKPIHPAEPNYTAPWNNDWLKKGGEGT